MKRNLLKLYLAALAVIGGAGEGINGQVSQIPQIPSYTPSPTVYSPQTSAMVRYDEVPVNLCTGRVDFNIPLVHIKDRDFNFPITMSYSADGFKPAEADNYVGRNWVLNCGGVIYRQVRGIPDDMADYSTSVEIIEGGGKQYNFKGFMSLLGHGRFDMDEMRNSIVDNPYKYASIKDNFAPMPTITGTDIESAPDMYYFKFGQHSGKFMINFDGSVSVVGYSGHKYEVDLSEYEMATSLYAHSTIIRIKTDDGYTYTFGGTDYGPVEYSVASWEKKTPVTGYDAYHKHTINAWYLTEIKAPNGRCLTIHYKEIDESYHRNFASLIDIGVLPEKEWQQIASLFSLTGHAAYRNPKPLGVGTLPGELYDKKANSYFYNLSKIALVDYISVGNCKVDFHYSLKQKYTPFEYVPEGYYRFRGAQLDSINVSYEGKNIQTHSFGYTYQCANRLFLTSLKHAQQGTYRFLYNIPSGAILPTTSNIDHWGYWTGGTIDKDIMPGTRYASNIIANEFKLTTSLRDPSPADCDATLLYTVVYPTGGKAVFEYEPHKYSYLFEQNRDTFYENTKLSAPGYEAIAGGARIKNMKFYDEDAKSPAKEVQYEYADDSGMEGVLSYIPLYRCVGTYLVDDHTILGFTIENSDGIGSQYKPSQHILYPTVKEYYIDSKSGAGKAGSPYKETFFYTEDHYKDYTDFIYSTYTNDEYNSFRYTLGGRMDMVYYYKNRFRWPGINLSYKNGRVRGEYYYNDQHRMEREVDYEYEEVHRPDYGMCIYVESLQPGSFYGIYTHVNREFFSSTLLKRKTVLESDEAYRQTSQKELYEYDGLGYLTQHTQVLTGGDSLQTSYRYLENMPSLVTDKIQEMHREGKKKAIQAVHLDYQMHPVWGTEEVWPVAFRHFLGTDSQSLEVRALYLVYDRYGNPVHIRKDGIDNIFIWGYDGQYPVAQIENATYEEVAEALGGDAPEIVSGKEDYSIIADAVEGLRNKLPLAKISNYTYISGVGMASATDPSGKTMFYEYDECGRLVQTYRLSENGKKEILQLNDYHIINQ